MDAEKLTKLVTDAKYLYDHGVFTTLAQAEFFAAVSDAAAPAPAPAPEPAPPASAPASISEGADGMVSTATIGPSTRGGTK
jgi:hypothetical protein